MKDLQNIVDNMSHVGTIRNWEDSHFNEYVVTGIQAGPDGGVNRRIGRVVQVRLKGGSFGTELVLLRHPDGILTSHENQSFVPLKGERRKLIENVFIDNGVCDDDPFNNAYTISDGQPEKGFIILDDAAKRLKREDKLNDLINDN